MLDPEDVDEGYFTPVASTSLANIFKNRSSNDDLLNATLKYKPSQPKKPDKSPKSDDLNATQCVFSSPIIAYQWIQEAPKCKGKVGFAIMKVINTGVCKIIIYSPEKSTLSCTTISPQLEVTLKGAMISLYDDHKKYWGLYFNDTIIEDVKKILQKENVIINYYESQQLNVMSLKHEVEDIHVDDTVDEKENCNIAEDNESISNNEKASILSRIANVGHAILPSPASPKRAPLAVNTTESFNYTERLNVLSDASGSSSTQASEKDLTRTIAVQADVNDQHGIDQLSIQHPITSLPFVNNQVFTYLNGCMVPVQAPVVKTIRSGITTTDIEDIIHRLTHLQNLVKITEIFTNDPPDTNHDQIEQGLEKIFNLEEQVQSKNDIILDLQRAVMNEKEKSCEIIMQQSHNSNTLKKQLEEMKQDLFIKEEEIRNMVSRSEANSLMATTVKKLMNDTFRSLASNFESEVSYSGNDIKAILAGVIKRCTIESLSTILSNYDVPNLSTEPAV